MRVEELVKQNDYKLIAGKAGLKRNIKNVYICDLLSWVMSHASKDDAWITIMTNINIVAVALLTETACIIVPEGIQIEKDTVQKAENEGIAILSTNMTSYEIALNLNKNI